MRTAASHSAHVVTHLEHELWSLARFHSVHEGARVRPVLGCCNPHRGSVEAHPARVVAQCVANGYLIDEVAEGIHRQDQAAAALDVDGGDPPRVADPDHSLRMEGVECELQLGDQLPCGRAGQRRNGRGRGPAARVVSKHVLPSIPGPRERNVDPIWLLRSRPTRRRCGQSFAVVTGTVARTCNDQSGLPFASKYFSRASRWPFAPEPTSPPLRTFLIVSSRSSSS